MEKENVLAELLQMLQERKKEILKNKVNCERSLLSSAWGMNNYYDGKLHMLERIESEIAILKLKYDQ